jgi:hypothetical protein
MRTLGWGQFNFDRRNKMSKTINKWNPIPGKVNPLHLTVPADYPRIMPLFGFGVALGLNRKIAGLKKLDYETMFEGGIAFPPPDVSAINNPASDIAWINQYLDACETLRNAYNQSVKDSKTEELARITEQAPIITRTAWLYMCGFNRLAAMDGVAAVSTPTIPEELRDLYLEASSK